MKRWLILALIIFSIGLSTAAIEIVSNDNTNKIINLKEAVSGVGTFLGLTDTPDSYAGEATNCIKVNAGEDALEFGACGEGGGGGDHFNQELNTTSNVTFNVVVAGNLSSLGEINIGNIGNNPCITSNGSFCRNNSGLYYQSGI